VAGELGLRFYAGMPLTTVDGHNLGTLCVIDRQPRTVTEEELATLRDLAAVVMDQLELRLTAQRTVSRQAALRRHAEDMAGALQASLLPPRPPAVQGMEIATRYRPGVTDLQVGGDFYDVFRLGPNDWGLTIGDVCGKGARAASLTGLARWSIRGAAVHSFLPSAVLHDLNAVLVTDGDPEADDHYCSVVFGRLELDTCGAWVTLASAGHPRPIVVRRAGWIDVRGHVGTPLGMFESASVGDDRVGLGPGDALFLCTDGITEARDRRGELFDDEGLPETLLEHAGCPADVIADAVIDAANEFSDNPARDDVAVLVVRVPEDARERAIDRVEQATGVPSQDLRLPGYPMGDRQHDLWKQRPEPPREARIRLAAEVDSVAALRRLLGRLLSSWRMDEVADGDIALLASELATNAVSHAESRFTVIIRYTGAAVRVEVGDGSRELPVLRAPDFEDAHGRGLVLVEALASAWGVIPTVDGKRTWFEVPV
jgi:sigma-B regulation protein RsbU (phosphoserine phosphatase)